MFTRRARRADRRRSRHRPPDIVIPSPARSLAAVHEQRRSLEAQISELLEAHPLHQVLTSMPGLAVRTAAVLLVTVGGGTFHESGKHLASLDERRRGPPPGEE